MKRVLIIAAHPDDEILGCGGLISKYQALGVIFKILFIGEGSSCRFEEPKSNEALMEIKERNSSAIRSLKSLGIIDVEFNNLPCGRLDQVPIISINKIIENAINTFLPDTVITHSPYDANNDHKIVFNATIMATRPAAQNVVNKVMSYEVLSSSEWAYVQTFAPNYFEELTEKDVESKWQALSHYETEIKNYPFPRSRDGVRALAMIRGMQSGVKFAEAFHLIRKFQK
jgi:LmbE family N-acetylglucosaminyl deacetylase